jgi:two-component system nitrate/nitrite response regulator NarL
LPEFVPSPREDSQLRTDIAPPDLSVQPAIIRILVTDSTRMGSQLLADALQRDPRIEIVGVCASAEETLSALVSTRPDVAILGLNLDEQPSKGLDVCRQARALYPQCRSVLLLESSKKESVLGAFGAGARGVFCRAESIETLRKCLEVVHSGQVWANSVEMHHVLEAFADAAPARLTDSRGTVLLSKRQQDIVHCITEGLTNREIAARLKLSEHTVKNYIFRIFDRLGVSTRVEMVLYAFSQRDALKSDGKGPAMVSLDDMPEVERYMRLTDSDAVMAPLRLGEMFRDGRKTEKDKPSAYMWFLIAERISREVSAHARAALEEMTGEIDLNAIHNAQRLAADWLVDHDFRQSETPVVANRRRRTRRPSENKLSSVRGSSQD